MNYTMHVVSHTHWDREWYLTFQQFRMRLVDLVDHLLDILDIDPEFKYFHLDGQTIVLEDYLEIRPQNEGRLRKYISEGRILIGPWYQLNDEFLVSGESTVRSLLIGHRMAMDFGGAMKIGYLPDQFGNISQMPQIFREFGIDNCIFGRGLQLVDGEKMGFYWVSPDGSEVISSLMAFWYNNAQRFPYEIGEAVEYTKQIRDRMAPHAATPELLLMNGVDHLEAQEGLPYILNEVNKRLKGDRLIHSTMPDYINAVKDYVKKHNLDLRHVHGELRQDRGGSVLAGTLSSRMYLKQANTESEIQLEKYAEPSSSFAWMLGREYPADMLTYAWKLLMHNHPHDSICGCSLDQVHDEMMPRFAQVQQIGRELTERSMDYIASNIKTEADSLVIFNTLSWPRTDKVVVDIDFPMGEPVRGHPTVDQSRDVAAVEIVDQQARSVPYKLLDRKICAKTVLSPVELPKVVMVQRFSIEFVAEDVPACGYTTYRIDRVPSMPKFEDSLSNLVYWENAISNGEVTVSLGNGGVTVETLSDDGGLLYTEQGMIEDGGDVGDEYRYVKPIRDRIAASLGGGSEVELIDNSPASATFKVRTVMRLPASAEPDCRGRTEQTVECPVTNYYTVTAKSPRVDVVTEIENHAKDHRFRVLFPSGITTDDAHAEGQYDVVTRSIRPPDDWQGASTFFPQRSWVDVNDGDKGLTIINKGLPEYEVYDDEARTVAVTLLRCIGRLSGSGDTPNVIHTPGAQCLGTYRFEYAILPHKGTWLDAHVWQQAHQHNAPLICRQTGAHDGELSPEHCFMEISPAELVVTAIKKAEDRDSLLVRFFNISSDDVHGARIKADKAASARTVNLNEEPGNTLTMEKDGSVLIDVPGKKIATVEFTFGG